MSHQDTPVGIKANHDTWKACQSVFSEARREQLVQALLTRVQHNAAEIEQGNFITLEEAKRRLLSDD